MMRRIKRLLKQNNGMALLLVLCLFALLMALGASVFFASVTSVKSTSRQTDSEQAYMSALSVSEVLKEQVTASGMTDFKNRIEGLKNPEVDGVTPQECFIEFTSDLPGQMGTVHGTFNRISEDQAILKVTASSRNEEYVLELSFTRLEVTVDPVNPVPPEIKWMFGEYKAK